MGEVVDLTLGTLCEGALSTQFNLALPEVVKSLREGQKGSITITVDLQKPKDTTTICHVSYKLKTSTPAQKKTSFCQIGKDGKLLTEKPAPQPDNVLTLFTNEEAENK